MKSCELEKRKDEFFNSLTQEDKEKLFGREVFTEVDRTTRSKRRGMLELDSRTGSNAKEKVHSSKINDKVQNENRKKFCPHKLLIPHDSKLKHIFDMFVLLVLAVSCASMLYL
jgi:hypothetical protein